MRVSKTLRAEAMADDEETARRAKAYTVRCSMVQSLLLAARGGRTCRSSERLLGAHIAFDVRGGIRA